MTRLLCFLLLVALNAGAVELPEGMKEVKPSVRGHDTLICDASKSAPGHCSMHSETQSWTWTPVQFANNAGYKIVYAVTMATMSGDLYIVMEVGR